MCVFKYHAFIYFLRPPPWYGTVGLIFMPKKYSCDSSFAIIPKCLQHKIVTLCILYCRESRLCCAIFSAKSWLHSHSSWVVVMDRTQYTCWTSKDKSCLSKDNKARKLDACIILLSRNNSNVWKIIITLGTVQWKFLLLLSLVEF